jgi:hypothetical protein
VLVEIPVLITPVLTQLEVSFVMTELSEFSTGIWPFTIVRVSLHENEGLMVK